MLLSSPVAAGSSRTAKPTGPTYPARVGTSFVDYRGCGFWTRDAALETVLGLLVAELQPLSEDDSALSAILDSWTLQATAGFMGCVSPALSDNLASPGMSALLTAGLRRILAGLQGDGPISADDPGFIARAERVSDGGPWRCPSARAPWVIEVGKALLDLIDGQLPATPDDFWFVDGLGRRKLPRIRPPRSSPASARPQ